MQDGNDDLLWRIRELYEQLSNEKSFWEKIATTISGEFGEEFSKDRVRGLYRRSNTQPNEFREEVETKPDLTIESDGISSVDELLARANVDLETYSVDHFILNEWDGKEQVKVWLKRKTPDLFDQDDFLDRIDKVVSRHLAREPQNPTPPFRPNQREYLFIPILFDAHTDSPKFDGDYLGWLQKLMQLGIAAGYKPTQCLYVIGQDFGHIDNENYTTTGGTLVGSKRTYLDSVDERCSLVMKASDYIRSYVPNLDIVAVPGNHDRFSTYWLARVLDAYFRNDLSVSVFNGQSPRKYYRYGKTLFGLTHGNEEKQFDLAGLMAVEAPLEWAASDNRIWLTGHFHQQKTMYNMLSERFGVVQRIFPSLVSPDDWHILKGYIGNSRAAQLLVYDLDGFVAEFSLSVK